jgi:hypothetical protein
VYVYGAVSPLEGDLDWRLCREMNTLRMGEFLLQVSQAHPTEFMVMVVDGASSHKAKDLVIPDNIRLLALPPYAPELNPQEHIWDEVREKAFPNRVFSHLAALVQQPEQGLPRLAADRGRLHSLTAWPWIISLNLNANYNERLRVVDVISVGEVAISLGVEVQRAVGAVHSQHGNDAVAPVEGKKLFGSADFRHVGARAHQRNHDAAQFDCLLDLRAPNPAAANALGVEPGVEALFLQVFLQALGERGSVLAA